MPSAVAISGTDMPPASIDAAAFCVTANGRRGVEVGRALADLARPELFSGGADFAEIRSAVSDSR